MVLMRFDPFREADRVAEQAWAALRGRPFAMPMDAYRRGEEVVVDLDLPGVDPSTIDLTVEKNVLTVSAARPEHRDEGDEVIVAERPYGSFSRQLFLGEGLDLEKVSASYENGVLSIHVPVAETAKPRKVAIAVGGDAGRHSAIEAEATAKAS
jgi:HSP20 family protein